MLLVFLIIFFYLAILLKSLWNARSKGRHYKTELLRLVSVNNFEWNKLQLVTSQQSQILKQKNNNVTLNAGVTYKNVSVAIEIQFVAHQLSNSNCYTLSHKPRWTYLPSGGVFCNLPELGGCASELWSTYKVVFKIHLYKNL